MSSSRQAAYDSVRRRWYRRQESCMAV